MKTIRKEYPRVRQYVKGENTYYRVDLRRAGYQGPGTRNFTEREAALKFASDRSALLAQKGMIALNSTHNEVLEKMEQQAALYRKTALEVFQMGLNHCEKELVKLESPFLGELVTLWIDDKTTNKLKPLRERSKKSIRNMGNIFKEDFGTKRIKEITREMIEQYLNDKDVSNQYRKNICNYLGQFFNWCIHKGYHNHNPTEKIEIHIQNGAPEFFTVEQSIKIMDEAKKDKEMTAYFSLCLFGGIRPEEVERMTWDHINLQTGEIFIPATISKTKKNRLFKINDCLFHWLNYSQNIKPLVPPANIKNKRVKICKALGFDWIQDGMRHTFATFHYAKEHTLEELRHIMGNSPGVIERFYKGVIPQAEIEKFWNIAP